MAVAMELDDWQVKGKTLLVRVDVNVPIHGGVITDDTRIRRVLPTIRALSERGAKVVLLSHFGRPEGKRDGKYTLAPVADALTEMLPGIGVHFAPDCIGEEAKKAIARMKPSEVVLCENLRFHSGEEEGDAAFARQLAALGDGYVNDAFSCSHRAHASITGLAEILPSCFGYAMKEEMAMLQSVFATPNPPVAALVGGSKVSTKMALLDHLVQTMDILCIGGGMANTFLYAQGHEVGASLCERELAELARSILERAEKAGCRILLPEDVVVAERFAAHAPCRVVDVAKIPRDGMALDVGPRTVRQWAHAIKQSRTLVWNGPVGAFETSPFDVATVSLARSVAHYTASGTLTSVAGGGDTVAALEHAGLSGQMTYVSTAGGAFLEWLEGKALPGVEAIENAHIRSLAG